MREKNLEKLVDKLYTLLVTIEEDITQEIKRCAEDRDDWEIMLMETVAAKHIAKILRTSLKLK